MKFAHFSDIHLGFQNKKTLQDVERTVFERAMDDCIKRTVDFILICGDMFHVPIPAMRVQKFVFAKLRQVYEAGIPVYVVFGSHDFSPSSTSVIDLLVEIGYITKVQLMVSHEDDKSVSLDFITDPKTNAKLAGIAGLSASKDIIYYQNLRLKELESEPGFKIFLFHGAISEMRTTDDIEATASAAMPISYMPKNFAYYAGGHIHKYQHKNFDNYPHVVYPGTLFAGFPLDLEENTRTNVKRGYVLVEFDHSGITNVEQIPIENCQYELIEVDASHKKPVAVNAEIKAKIKDIDPTDKVVILSVKGKLSEGKTTDISFTDTRHDLTDGGALEVEIKRNQLSSAEYEIVESKGDTDDEIIENTLSENIGQVDGPYDELMGKKGVNLAKNMLRVLSNPPLDNEPQEVYRSRITDEAISTLGLSDQTDNKENKTEVSNIDDS